MFWQGFTNARQNHPILSAKVLERTPRSLKQSKYDSTDISKNCWVPEISVGLQANMIINNVMFS